MGLHGKWGRCGPDQCAPARQAFRHLDPVVDHLTAFHEREGRYPARLEEAYPEGFPPGLANKTGADYAEIETLNSGRYRAPLLLGGSLVACKEKPETMEGNGQHDVAFDPHGRRGVRRWQRRIERDLHMMRQATSLITEPQLSFARNAPRRFTNVAQHYN